jgi:hypothetical protein
MRPNHENHHWNRRPISVFVCQTPSRERWRVFYPDAVNALIGRATLFHKNVRNPRCSDRLLN